MVNYKSFNKSIYPKCTEMVVDNYFSTQNGFGEHKKIAIDLLKKVVDVLNDFRVNHFLISGTLLGYVRHQELIPWDDDIDLIVESNLLDVLPDVVKKYPNLTFMCQNKIVKVCFKDQGVEILEDQYKWKLPDEKYNWPFVDLFTYELKQKQMFFFNKNWETNKFFNAKKINFLGIETFVPNDPDYFLKINYGPRYMVELKSSSYSHKLEKSISPIKIISFEDFKRWSKD